MCIGLGMGATVIWENPRHVDYNSYSSYNSATETSADTESKGAAA